jgi:membrane associated rhomboid family serine protease
MLFLWIFGDNVEHRIGHGLFIVFYLVAGVIASFAQIMIDTDSFIPTLGASGAISGVLGSFILLFPLARLIIMIPILFFPFFFEVPALFFAGFWFLTQLMAGTVELFAPSGGGGIAWWAHIGGFVAGVALTPLLHRSHQRYRTYNADEGILGFNPAGR